MVFGVASGWVSNASCVVIPFMRVVWTRCHPPDTTVKNMITALIENSLRLALDSAPWLLFGLIAAGVIHAWLPMRLVGRALGGSGPVAVIKAALIGAPLPLCSCGTLPAALSLSRAGASRASTTSFLISTPETGVDSVALSWVLLGPVLALLRPVAAIISAVSAGLLVGAAEVRSETDETAGLVVEPASTTACCSPDGTVIGDKVKAGLWRRTIDGLNYAFTDLLDDLALWLLVGIVAAGTVVTLIPPDLLVEWGSGLGAMLLILLISVPMYVCATASTPLAHAMLFAGVSPGTVLVFLLAGPASNIASLVLVRRELGGRALAAYLFGICGVSILLGLALDWVVGVYGIDLLSGLNLMGDTAHEPPGAIASLSLLLLMVCGIKPLRRYISRGKGGDEGGCCG